MSIEDEIDYRSLLAGTLAGLTIMIALDSCQGPIVNSAKIFTEKDKPSIIRLYKDLSRDQFLIEDKGKQNTYVPYDIKEEFYKKYE